jgi:hypothetical protein
MRSRETTAPGLDGMQQITLYSNALREEFLSWVAFECVTVVEMTFLLDFRLACEPAAF